MALPLKAEHAISFASESVAPPNFRLSWTGLGEHPGICLKCQTNAAPTVQRVERDVRDQHIKKDSRELLQVRRWCALGPRLSVRSYGLFTPTSPTTPTLEGMDDDYEDLRVEFTLFPGVDLRLWLLLVVAALALAGVAIAAALVAG